MIHSNGDDCSTTSNLETWSPGKLEESDTEEEEDSIGTPECGFRYLFPSDTEEEEGEALDTALLRRGFSASTTAQCREIAVLVAVP